MPDPRAEEPRSDEAVQAHDCPRHPNYPLTRVKQGPVIWSYCGLCEAGKLRAFLLDMRDPWTKRRIEAALYG